MTSFNSRKVLTIGNSFSHSVTSFLPDIVSSVPGCELLLEEASHGGCELHRHWHYIECEESDQVFSMYQDRRWKLREILAREEWEIVTIQQASRFSWKPETYQPYANLICEYVRKHAPQAEIVVQQTWAYRTDAPQIALAGLWGINQEEMYERLTMAYEQVAKELGLRIIPTGHAVQMARRKQQEEAFQAYPSNMMNTLRWPDLPPQAGALVGKIYWTKNQETGELELGRDTIHLNDRGKFLQACVWFGFLFQRPVEEITFVPTTIGAQDANFLRDIAAQTLEKYC